MVFDIIPSQFDPAVTYNLYTQPFETTPEEILEELAAQWKEWYPSSITKIKDKLKGWMVNPVKRLLGKKGGLNYIKIKSNVLNNLFYPNFYISPINFFLRKFYKFFN